MVPSYVNDAISLIFCSPHWLYGIYFFLFVGRNEFRYEYEQLLANNDNNMVITMRYSRMLTGLQETE